MYISTNSPTYTDDTLGDVYILRLGQPLGSPDTHKAEYYIGWAAPGNLYQRLEEHRAGQGASMTREAARRGIEIELVMHVAGTRRDERRFKNIHAARVLARFLRGTAKYPHTATFHDAAKRVIESD